MIRGCVIGSLLLLAGCVPLYIEHDAGAIAQREWSRISSLPIEWTVVASLGSPAVLTEEHNGRYIGWLYLPPGAMYTLVGRAVARYEMRKMAWVHGSGWFWPVAQVDAFFHLPPSELASWLAVMWPSDPARVGITAARIKR